MKNEKTNESCCHCDSVATHQLDLTNHLDGMCKVCDTCRGRVREDMPFIPIDLPLPPISRVERYQIAEVIKASIAESLQQWAEGTGE
jgi:hypothetical protein